MPALASQILILGEGVELTRLAAVDLDQAEDLTHYPALGLVLARSGAPIPAALASHVIATEPARCYQLAALRPLNPADAPR